MILARLGLARAFQALGLVERLASQEPPTAGRPGNVNYDVYLGRNSRFISGAINHLNSCALVFELWFCDSQDGSRRRGKARGVTNATSAVVTGKNGHVRRMVRCLDRSDNRSGPRCSAVAQNAMIEEKRIRAGCVRKTHQCSADRQRRISIRKFGAASTAEHCSQMVKSDYGSRVAHTYQLRELGFMHAFNVADAN